MSLPVAGTIAPVRKHHITTN